MFTLFDSAGLMPHGYCLLWQPSLLALHAVSDLLIFLSYFAIPFAILRVLRDKPELRFGQIGTLFAAFILLCGLTHLVGLITLWLPIYEMQGVLKALTAVVSAATVAALFPLLPQIVSMPDPGALEAANRRLRAEIDRHEATLGELESLRERLEDTIEDRTRLLREAKRRERDAAGEALHRARTTLGVVQSLTRQSAAFATDKEDFSHALSGRIAALGSVLAALGSQGSNVVALGRLVRAEAVRHDEIDTANVAVEGPEIEISAHAAQNLGLAIHELFRSMTESHGGPGSARWVRVSWGCEEAAQGASLVLVWEDGGGDSGRTPGGLAAALLERGLPIQMRGRAVIEPTADGLRYTLAVPVREIVERPPEAIIAPAHDQAAIGAA